jgi:hypothetical protein
MVPRLIWYPVNPERRSRKAFCTEGFCTKELAKRTRETNRRNRRVGRTTKGLNFLDRIA